jgi:hypothetical protein
MNPRLHVLLARNGKTGVVLRRGPTWHYCAIGWDRAKDAFTVGQWLKGRIYERRCDLSIDGKYMIYFAMNGHWGSAAKGAWTAVSRAPYLSAVALWSKGDCWHGGGLFVDANHKQAARTYWLNDGYGHAHLADTGETRRADPPPYHAWGGECWGVYFQRLIRDGWTMHPELEHGTDGARAIVFEKPLAHGWSLRRLAYSMIGAPPGKGVYFDEHELVHANGRELPRPDWEWAERDGDRLVWAEAGALWAGEVAPRSGKHKDPIVRPRLLHDFRAMKFEALTAPYAKAEP